MFDRLYMQPAEDMQSRMARGWKSGLPHTRCGSGSLPENTAKIREVLPLWCRRYDIRTVNDAGAGDLSWLRGLAWDVQYRPFDLIAWHPSVTQADISTETLPACDLILCRWVLNHLDPARVGMALQRFRKAARYLAATQFDGGRRALGHLDLRGELGEPLDAVEDAGVPGCTLALWRV